eukprot:gene24222-29292_t
MFVHPYHAAVPVMSRYRPLRQLASSAISLPQTLQNVNIDGKLAVSTTKHSYLVYNRSLSCLDLPTLLASVQNLTQTYAGSQLLSTKQASSAEESEHMYREVHLGGRGLVSWPLTSSLSRVLPIVNQLERNTGIPQRDDLMDFMVDLLEMAGMQEYLSVFGDEYVLNPYIPPLTFPPELIHTFNESFDEDGRLNVKKYPQLKEYRQQIDLLTGRIYGILNGMIAREMKDKVEVTSVMEYNGRYCLLVANTFKRGIGIIHGYSNTGRSVYVEPSAVVELTNELGLAQEKLKQEENTILNDMCRSIYKHREDIKRGVHAIAQLDVIRAKYLWGQKVEGVIPKVGNEGVLDVHSARHPLLVLKHAQRVVGNRILLDDNTQGIVISGPNAGGKTVVLKTAGLFAYMVKYAIPLPCAHPTTDQSPHTDPHTPPYTCRVDFFSHVLADIGDMQTLSGDQREGVELSTFSGHLLMCKEMLDIAHQTHALNLRDPLCRRDVLLLLDELGTGTDPTEGLALAHSILQEYVDLRCRVIITTHFSLLKELALTDPRLRIAAMEWRDVKETNSLVFSRPTYRMNLGFAGSSHAFDLAERIFLSPNSYANPYASSTYASSSTDLEATMDVEVDVEVGDLDSSSTYGRAKEMLHRARGLLDQETQRLMQLQKQMEVERQVMLKLQADYTEKLEKVKDTESDLQQQREALDREIWQVRNNAREKYLEQVKEREAFLERYIQQAEQLVKDTIENMKDAAKAASFSETQARMQTQQIQASLSSIHAQIHSQRVQVEKEVIEARLDASRAASAPQASPLEEKGEPVDVGTTLVILEPGELYGSKCVVSQRNKGRGRVCVRVGVVEMKLDRHLLGRPAKADVSTVKRLMEINGVSPSPRPSALSASASASTEIGRVSVVGLSGVKSAVDRVLGEIERLLIQSSAAPTALLVDAGADQGVLLGKVKEELGQMARARGSFIKDVKDREGGGLLVQIDI